MIEGLTSKQVQLGNDEFELKELTMDQFDKFIEMVVGRKVPSLDEFVKTILNPKDLFAFIKKEGKIKEFIEVILRVKFGKGKLKDVAFGEIPVRQVREISKVFFSINEENMIDLQKLLANLISKGMDILTAQKNQKV